MRVLRLLIVLFVFVLAVDLIAITALGTKASRTFQTVQQVQQAQSAERPSSSWLPGVFIAVIAGAWLLLLVVVFRATFEKRTDRPSGGPESEDK